MLFWHSFLVFLFWPSVFSSIEAEDKVRPLGSPLELSIIQVHFFDFFFMLHLMQVKRSQTFRLLRSKFECRLEHFLVKCHLASLPNVYDLQSSQTVKWDKRTYLVGMLKGFKAVYIKMPNMAQRKYSINDTVYITDSSNPLPLLYSFAVWFYHHLCGGFSSGPSFGSVKQYHWNQAGCIQICYPVAEAFASQSNWHR